MSLTVNRIGGRIGAEITGVDLKAELDARAIHDALVEHKVLVFRGQHLDDEQHQRFASIFGPLTLAHPTVPSVDGQANVLEVAGGEGARANAWHTDVTFVVAPPKATTLRSLVIPPLFRRDQWVIWQYHNRGRRPGVKGDLDLNVFRGSRAEFEAFAAGAAPAATAR